MSASWTARSRIDVGARDALKLWVLMGSQTRLTKVPSNFGRWSTWSAAAALASAAQADERLA